MKNQLFALIGLGLLLATASAYAQTGVVKANVPFNFIVDKTQIPAGEYVIQNLGTAGLAMSIQSSDRKMVKVVLPNACESSQAQPKTKLVFHRYGDQYFLHQIRFSRDREYTFPASVAEREMIRAAVDTHGPGQVLVTVAAAR